MCKLQLKSDWSVSHSNCEQKRSRAGTCGSKIISSAIRYIWKYVRCEIGNCIWVYYTCFRFKCDNLKLCTLRRKYRHIVTSYIVWQCCIIARRHGHVFRMALHNEGDWRMETWQRALRASCHVSIRQSPSCVMPFWTHAKCLLAFISYLPMWIKAKYTFIKTVYSPRFYGGPYLQAKHADVRSGVLFWTACTRRPHVLSLPSSSGCEKSDSWRQARSVKSAKKVMNGTTMWSCDTELCTNGVEATKCSIYSTSRCRCHTGTDIPRLRGHTLQINQVVRTVRHRISGCAPTIHWKCDAQIQNRQIKSPSALWKHLSFQCLGVIVTLNGKSASMLLEPTKNKLKQWRVIEKSVNKCNFFLRCFES